MSSIEASVAEENHSDEREPPFTLVSKAWKLENNRVQRSWNKRAGRLNTLEQVGIIENVPEPIAEANKDELICETMQHNWNVITKKF